jgi:hypothetical protein
MYVVLLSTKPCCDDNDCRVSGIVTKGHAGKVPAKTQECPGCSSFFTCGSCAGFVISEPLTIRLTAVAADHMVYGNVYSQPDLQEVAMAIWLPPKLS